MIKAAFFDIDGTLTPLGGDGKIVESALMALHILKEKGIKVFIATGRPPNSIGHITSQFEFDGYLCANGQYCFEGDNIIYENYIPHQSIQQIIPYINENKIPVLFALIDHCYRNSYNQTDFDKNWPEIDLYDLKDEKIVQIMAVIKPEEDEAFLKHLPYCKSARWTDRFADIIPDPGGKDLGIDKIIEYYGIKLDEVMAFGDGGNDIFMLQHVPHSVAMQKASDEVKEKASYVTSDVKDDGILNAFLHFGVIDESDIINYKK